MKKEEFKRIVEAMSTEELMKILVDKMRREEVEKEDMDEKEEIKNIKNDLKEETLYSGYLEGWDTEYGIQMQNRIKEAPILISILEDMNTEIHRPSKLYKIASTIRERIEEDLNSDMSDKSKKLLEQLKYCDEVILFDAMRDAFIYGYAISNEMKEETENYFSKKEE